MEDYEFELSETPNCNMKEIELIEGNIKYKWQIELINKYLNISLYNNTKNMKEKYIYLISSII